MGYSKEYFKVAQLENALSNLCELRDEYFYLGYVADAYKVCDAITRCKKQLAIARKQWAESKVTLCYSC